MKSILYVGATLMIGASIYGFVDYKNTSHKKDFTGMYEEKKITPAPPAPVVEEKKSEVTVAKKNTVIKSVTKKGIAKTQSSTVADETIHSIKPIADDAVIAASDIKTIEKSDVDPAIAKNSTPAKKITKKKKINSKMFSRAPIREEINFASEPEVSVSKKTDKKDK